jgi:hypothetical protein
MSNSNKDDQLNLTKAAKYDLSKWIKDDQLNRTIAAEQDPKN